MSHAKYFEYRETGNLNASTICRGLSNWLRLLLKNFWHPVGALIGLITGAGVAALFLSYVNILPSGSIIETLIGSVVGAVVGTLTFSTIYSVCRSILYLKIHSICRKLHTNACGDFMLMDSATWAKTKGYYEKPMYSWHLDSMFMFLTKALKIRCKIMPEDCIIYHIEHGGGWTPETEEALFRNLDSKGIPYFTWKNLCDIEQSIRKKTINSPYYNGPDWGMDGII